MKEMILAIMMAASIMVGCGEKEEVKQNVVEVHLTDLKSVNDVRHHIDDHEEEYDELFGDRNWTATFEYNELTHEGHYVVEPYKAEIYK